MKCSLKPNNNKKSFRQLKKIPTFPNYGEIVSEISFEVKLGFEEDCLTNATVQCRKLSSIMVIFKVA